MELKKRYVILSIFVFILTLFYISSYDSILDVMNAIIERSIERKSFYAGIEGLPASYEYIPEIKEIEDNWKEVRKEMENIYSEDIPTMQETYNNMYLYKGSGTNKNSRFSGLQKFLTKLIYGRYIDTFDKTGSDNWRTYNLILFNQDIKTNTSKCPRTTELLKKIPGMQNALFSIMKPGAYVPPHTDPLSGVIRYHLALKVPKDRENCFINVDGKNYHWEEGKGVIFDDGYYHWVKNDTDEIRVIVFVDIVRPLSGIAKKVQDFTDFINTYNPGVKRLLKESEIISEKEDKKINVK